MKKRKKLLLEYIISAGYNSLYDFVKNTQSHTGKQRSNALVYRHLEKGCYDIRQLRLYAKDLKLSLDETEKLFDVSKKI